VKTLAQALQALNPRLRSPSTTPSSPQPKSPRQDLLHDKICESVVVHLNEFMQITRSSDLDVECYAALRGQTNDQLTALDTLLYHAGSLRGNMDQLNAERVAMNSDFVTMAQNLSEVGENIQQVLAERDALLQEADSFRAAAERAEDARKALAAAHAAQQPSAAARLTPRFPPMTCALRGHLHAWLCRQCNVYYDVALACSGDDPRTHEESAGTHSAPSCEIIRSFWAYGAGRWLAPALRAAD
jgi:hypothetical protein